MKIETVRQYFLNKPEAQEGFPFGADVSVFKVRNKMFAFLFFKNNLPAINLKCDPDEAVALRDIFDSVMPGYHMNKRHWNTVYLDNSIPQGEIERMIDNSYCLVVKGLKKSERNSLELNKGAKRC